MTKMLNQYAFFFILTATCFTIKVSSMTLTLNELTDQLTVSISYIVLCTSVLCKIKMILRCAACVASKSSELKGFLGSVSLYMLLFYIYISYPSWRFYIGSMMRLGYYLFNSSFLVFCFCVDYWVSLDAPVHM